jgi:hypothetical protein
MIGTRHYRAMAVRLDRRAHALVVGGHADIGR